MLRCCLFTQRTQPGSIQPHKDNRSPGIWVRLGFVSLILITGRTDLKIALALIGCFAFKRRGFVIKKNKYSVSTEGISMAAYGKIFQF